KRGDAERRAGLDAATGAQRTADVIAELRLGSVERDELVLQELVGALIEAVPIERAFGGARREVLRHGAVLRDMLRVEPLEQAVERRSECKASVHGRHRWDPHF